MERIEVLLHRGMADEWVSGTAVDGGVELDNEPPGMSRSVTDADIAGKRPIGYYRFWILDERTQKRRLSKHRMTLADALLRHPGAEVDESSREVRSYAGGAGDLQPGK